MTSFRTSAPYGRHSMPAYMSSAFSRKITMSTASGCFTWLGTPADWPEAHVQVEYPLQGDVQRPDAAAKGRRQRTLDADGELLNAATA